MTLRTVALACLFAAACGDKGDDSPAPTTPEPTPTADTGPTTTTPTADTATEPFEEITWTDAATQPLQGSSSIAAAVAAEAQSIELDWSGLTTDALGAPLDPATITEVVLAEVYTDDVPAMEALLAGRGPSPDAVTEWWTANVPGRDQVTMGEFTARGAFFSAPNYFTVDNERGWFVLLRDDTGQALQGITLEPAVGYPDAVAIADGSWSVEHSFGPESEPLTVPADFTGNLTIKELSLDSFGQPLVEGVVDGVVLVPAGPDPTSLDLASLARPSGDAYRTTIEPGTIDIELADLANDQGPFPGIGDEQWLLGLTCSTCANVVPAAVTWLAPLPQ